jgi:hypothetical protein
MWNCRKKAQKAHKEVAQYGMSRAKALPWAILFRVFSPSAFVPFCISVYQRQSAVETFCVLCVSLRQKTFV